MLVLSRASPMVGLLTFGVQQDGLTQNRGRAPLMGSSLSWPAWVPQSPDHEFVLCLVAGVPLDCRRKLMDAAETGL